MVHQHLRKTNLAFCLHQFRRSPHSTRRSTATSFNPNCSSGSPWSRVHSNLSRDLPHLAYYLTLYSAVFFCGSLETGGNTSRPRVGSGSRSQDLLVAIGYPCVVRTSFSEPVTKSASGLPGMYSLQFYLVAPKSSEKVYKHGYYEPSEPAPLEPPSVTAYTLPVPDNWYSRLRLLRRSCQAR